MLYSHKVKLRDAKQKHCERPAAVSTGIFMSETFRRLDLNGMIILKWIFKK
jgi:hypothetical protein